MLLKEIGLELECWLLQDGKIIEAPKYNFPADEMGFLIELRSPWGSNSADIIRCLEEQLYHAECKAKSLDFNLSTDPYKEVSKDWQIYISKKYQHAGMSDNTRNIYDIQETQHTGFRDNRATAGLHIHFSVWDTTQEKFRWLKDFEIHQIVEMMDERFEDTIKSAQRISGEWEPKGLDGDSGRPHGFEYRSLPANSLKFTVAQTSLDILDKVVK